MNQGLPAEKFTKGYCGSDDALPLPMEFQIPHQGDDPQMAEACCSVPSGVRRNDSMLDAQRDAPGGYLKQHQAEYYRRLSAIRTEANWESWVTFSIEGAAVAAGDAESNIIEVASLVAADR
jgi:hypothetical protein